MQVTYLGYPNTTGLETIDYFLTDCRVDPPGFEAHFTERLIRLPDGFCCYKHIESDPGISPLPAVGAGYVTFGSTHVLSRLNRAVLDTWCDVLRAVPQSRLLIFRDTLQDGVRGDLLASITSRGISAERVDLHHEIAGPGGYMGIYREIDICLDTFPWSGHTSACQSLWFGVPIITLAGSRHAGRRVASVLHHAGLAEWIAGDLPDYVQKAALLAGDIPRLATIRAGLRDRLARSPLCDAARFTRGVEAAYRRMWRDFCEK